MTELTRRRALAALGGVGATALAGCSSVLGRAEPELTYQLAVDRVDDIVAAALWTPSDDEGLRATIDREAWQAVTSGERYTTYGFDPLSGVEYTEREGTYYHVDTFVTGSERMDRSILRLEWVGRIDELDDVPDYTAKTDLPSVDRHAALIAYFAARAREYEGGAPWDAIERGGFVYRTLDRDESELAPNPAHEYVRVHDTILRVEVSNELLVEPAHTATAVPVADSRDVFARIADAALVDARLSRSDLSERGRLILDRAQGQQGYEETTPLSAEYRAVLEGLQLREYLHASSGSAEHSGVNGRHLALDDEYYRYGLYLNDAE